MPENYTPDRYKDLLAPAREIYQGIKDQTAAATVKAEEATQHEENAGTAKEAAQTAAEEAIASAQAAEDVFRNAGNSCLSMDPSTKKMKIHLNVSESE